jgi:hypothetical protein
MDFDNESTLVCIGKFDPNGIPIITSRHLSQYATATFQAISLKKMLAQVLQSTEPLEVAYIRHQDGTTIRIDRNAEGFIAYLERVSEPADAAS